MLDIQENHKKYFRSQTIYELQDFFKKHGYYFLVGSKKHGQELRLDGTHLLDLLFALRMKEPTTGIEMWHRDIACLLSNLRPAKPDDSSSQ